MDLKPTQMNFDSGNVPENFKKWSQHMRLMLTGPLSEKTEKQQCSYFLLYIGQAGRDIYNTWSFTEEEEDKIEVLFQRFATYCQPKKNVTMNRFKFNSRIQRGDESIDQFVTDLRLLANDCNYDELKDSLIRDRIICGTNNEKIRERLLQEDDNTLERTIDIARAMEISQEQMTSFGKDIGVHVIHRKNTPKKYEKEKNKPAHCQNCGHTPYHPFSKCPAKDKICNYCKKKNHFSKMCRKLKHDKKTFPHKTMHTVSTEEDEVTFEAIDMNDTRDEVFTKLKLIIPGIPNASLKVKVDTGAQGNALPLRLYKRMFPEDIASDGMPKSLASSKKILTAYGGGKIIQYGTCNLQLEKDNVKHEATFYVTEDQGSAILGLPSARQMNLVTLNCKISKTEDLNKAEMIRQFPEVFNGIGKFQGKYHITIDKSVPPVVHAPRKVPLVLKEKIKTELGEMEGLDIIEKIKEGEPTTWVNSLVYREKTNGRLRLCLDPKDLNKAILREHYVTLTLEELTPKLAGATLFTTLDAKCGYWNVELDDESSYLTTFNTPFGRYRFKRMPFGLKMSQDIFQTKIDQTFEGCTGVIGITDDIIVYGKSEAEHDANLKEALKRCQETGLKLNPDKAQVKREEIKFFGVIVSKDGMRPDPAKVSALKDMSPPQTKQELQSFLGLATYMSKFIQNTSAMTASLRELLKETSKFEWNASHEEGFNDIKNAISESTTLSHFDSKKPCTLQVDASMKGLGATLMQDGRPIAFASKALMDEETRYANIEREMLAVVFGCERFHTYLYGKSFIVTSDHKPLESIKLKHLKSAPPRLQRMLLRVQHYDFKIQYIPGRDMHIADPLSRLSLRNKEKLEDLDVKIHSIMIEFSDKILNRIKEETRKDLELNTLKEIVYNGWPETIKETPQLCRPYWNYRDEISLEEGILLKSRRVIIPKVMQREILTKLHEPHLGIEKTQLRARTCVYWNNITKDIDQATRECQTCQRHQPDQRKEELIPTEIPPRPWHTIGTDLFHLNGHEYLLITDFFSKYSYVRKIPAGECTSQKITTLTKQILSEQGLVTKIKSDNGPQYSGKPYQDMIRQYNIAHETSSPHYPKSNGFIESQVKIVKHTLQKSFENNDDPYLALLALRTTPISNNVPSPAELLFGRSIADGLPRKIQSVRNERISENLAKRKEAQAQYYNRNAHHLPPLSPGQTVRVKNTQKKIWEPAIISHTLAAPRSYIIKKDDGSELRRNRSQIRPVPSPSPLTSEICRSPSREVKPTPEIRREPLFTHEKPKDVVESQASHQQPNTTPYITRSGRSVKKPNKYTI